MKRSRWMSTPTIVGIALTGLLTVVAPPAHAAGSGTIAFSGTAQLNPFPCPVNQTCSGSFAGSASGALSGVHGTAPWEVEIAAGPLSAWFYYTDDCPVGLLGSAHGDGVITHSLNGAAIGTYGPADGALLPYPVVSVTVPFWFHWDRAGLNAIISLFVDVKLVIQKPGPVYEDRWVVLSNMNGLINGAGSASFAPIGVPPICPSPGPLNAFVAGSVDIASA